MISNSHTISANKTINIIYNNSNEHNVEEENKIIDIIKNNISKYYLMTIDKNGNRDLNPYEVVEDYYSKILNDSSITLNATGRAGSTSPFIAGYTGCMQVFKNDLFCGTVNVCNELLLDRIIIPENIEDTPEAYIKYSSAIAQKAEESKTSTETTNTNETSKTEQTTNNAEHIKDETPKTGTESNTISVISSILSVISIISIAIVKRI